MSDNQSNVNEPGGGQPNPWEEMLRSMLGREAGDEIINAMRAQGIDPSEVAGNVKFPGSPMQMQSMMAQMRHLMESSPGPINWRMAHDIARQRAWGEGDPEITSAEGQRIRQALQVGDLWLDAVTDLEPSRGDRHAWRRSNWVDNTLDTWKQMVEPVAANASRALSDALKQQMDEMTNQGVGELPEGLSQIMGQAQPMMEKLSAAVFAGQIGEAIGGMSHEALGSTDVGMPMCTNGTTALVVANVNAFAEGFNIPTDEVYQFLALREVAHARLFNSVSWLRSEMLQAVQKYAAEIRIDTDAIHEAATSIDPTDMGALQNAMTAGAFTGETTEAQEKALEKLETQLALIEGWVETITFEAGRPYLPHIDQLRELMRRRRVAGGAAEQMLAKLIGLQMRPRQARNAAKLWEIVTAERGRAERDALWQHPDFAPNADELQDPEAFLAGRAAAAEADADIDAALEQMLEGTLGWAEGLEPGQDSEGDARRGDTAPDDGAGSGDGSGAGSGDDSGDGSGAGDAGADGSSDD
ncbi:MAG: zinc-dependent metalloprotease [Actinomycetaceae bacterium]|nr:zinc-dependent metalloprotease [Actinomycetaceae bacterium]